MYLSRINNLYIGNKHTYRIILVALGFMFGFFLSSCKNTTSSPKITITGHVYLNNDTGDTILDPVDFSGVEVGVYQLAEIDTTLLRIVGEYPSVGLPLTQELEFDHRNSTPLAVGSTDINGFFAIEGLAPGYYNVVALKDGWSRKYLYNIHVNEASKMGLEITLYPAIYIESRIIEPTIFKGERQYIFTNSCDVVAPTIIESGTILTVMENCDLRFYESVSCSSIDNSDTPWSITTLNGVFSHGSNLPDSTNYVDSIQFFQSDLQLRGGVVSRVRNGLSIRSQSADLTNMRFNYTGTAVNSTQSELSISNTVISNSSMTAISVLASAIDVHLTQSVIFRAHLAFAPNTSGQYFVSDNYFIANEIAIQTQQNYGTIQNNCFRNNDYDIRLVYSTALVKHNNFYLSNIQTIKEQGVSCPVNDNNFFFTNGYFFNIRSNPPTYCSVPSDIDATQNFWKPVTIGAYILDSDDNGYYPGQACLRSVIYNPREQVPVAVAGIRP